MRKRNSRNPGNKESGIALLIVLMALFLIAAVGMGMIFMANTETSINQNYRDTQTAFFAMRGGLEEMRDRMRSNAPSAWGRAEVSAVSIQATSVMSRRSPAHPVRCRLNPR